MAARFPRAGQLTLAGGYPHARVPEKLPPALCCRDVSLIERLPLLRVHFSRCLWGEANGKHLLVSLLC
jgi:hypothetical protein